MKEIKLVKYNVPRMYAAYGISNDWVLPVENADTEIAIEATFEMPDNFSQPGNDIIVDENDIICLIVTVNDTPVVIGKNKYYLKKLSERKIYLEKYPVLKKYGYK